MNRVVLIGIMWLLFTGVSLAAKPTAKELLKKYSEVLDKYKSYIIKSETFVKVHNSFSGRSKYYPAYLSVKRNSYYGFEIRYDGDHLKTLRYRWGDIYAQWMNVPESERHLSCWLWDGNNTYNYGYPYKNNEPTIAGPLLLFRGKLPHGISKKEAYESNLSRVDHGGWALGYFYGDDERIDRILQESDKIYVQDEMENIGGSNCYVIKAETNRGKFTLWIDPEHGFNIAKALVQKRENDGCYKITVEKNCVITVLVKNVYFKKMSGVWVPYESDIRINTTFSYGDFGRTKKRHKITEMILNPDHNALGSFLTDDILDGTEVWIDGVKPRYKWRDGKVVDKDGKEVKF